MARVRQCAKKIRLYLSRFAVNPHYSSQEFVKEFRSALKDKKPFPHWHLTTFLAIAPELFNRLHKELIEYKGWNRKENDLYSLYQTPDLKSINAQEYPTLGAFWDFLRGEMKEWLENTSGIELLDEVDATGSCYGTTDCLLPHSDQVENRRFAFVFYLSTEWSDAYGGQTNIYNCDDNCDPTTIFKSLPVTRNSLLLFEVSEKSWHSVAEVLGSNHDPRLSINGWFHTTRKVEPRIRPPLTRPRHVPQEDADLSTIFNDKILTDISCEGIRKTFGEEDELLVKMAFQESFREKILDELDSVSWTEKGPVNKRWIAEYDVEGNIPQETIAKFVKVIRSQTMMDFIKKMTGFEYEDPQTTIWAYRLTPRCYTVLGDEDAEQFLKDGISTDLWFYFGRSQWEEDAGGTVVYIRKDQKDPVLICPPTVDAMALVHRQKDMFPFVKYVNQLAGKDPFYVFGLSVYGGVAPEKSASVGAGDAQNQEDNG
ncbi:hypothetical protein COOONC_15896 [Cooperia oncophora]